MSLAEFRRYRDEHALEEYARRLPALCLQRDTLRAQWSVKQRDLLHFRHMKDRNAVDHLEYDLYDQDTGITWAWARVDAEIMAIERDTPARLARLWRVIPLD